MGLSGTETRRLAIHPSDFKAITSADLSAFTLVHRVNFTNATRWQAEGIFKNFFPCKPKDSATPEPSESARKNSADKDGESVRDALAAPKPRSPSHAVPLLDESEIAELAKRFAAAIPEDEMSVCCHFPCVSL